MDEFLPQGIQNDVPYEAPKLVGGTMGADQSVAAQPPEQYNMAGPEFDNPQTVNGEFIPEGTSLDGSGQPAANEVVDAMPAVQPGAGATGAVGVPAQQNGTGTAGQVTTPPVPQTGVTTPPNPGSPPVAGMPNQATPGWQGHKPEFLTEPPPNMPGPTEWRVDDNQTVLGQMRNARLSPEAAPLYERMRSAVVRGFLAKGGKNSLRAYQAAEMVVVETAFKIGAADAQVYARSAEFNATMKNQFSAAEQRFMHEALLSDQNFNQAKEIQRMQIEAENARAAANSASAAAYGSSQLDLMAAEQENWIERAAVSHRYNLDIIGVQNSNQRGVMRLGAELDGGLDDRRTNNLIRRDDNLTTNQLRLNENAQAHDVRMSNLGYQQTWSLNEQAQGHRLEQSDRNTDNAIRERGVAYGHQLALNYQSEILANIRNGNNLIAQILSTPGLSAAQQEAAIRTISSMTATTDELVGSYYANLGSGGGGGSRPGTGAGTFPGGSGVGPQTPASPNAPTSTRPGYSGGYSDYASFGNAYVAAPAPTPGQGGAVIGGSLRYQAAPIAPSPPTGG